MEDKRTESSGQKKPYAKPAVTRVKLEDKHVVSMASCKESIDNPNCARDTVPVSVINPS
jgi:hypothetical protein